MLHPISLLPSWNVCTPRQPTECGTRSTKRVCQVIFPRWSSSPKHPSSTTNGKRTSSLEASRSDSIPSSTRSLGERQMSESSYEADETRRTTIIPTMPITIYLRPKRSLTRSYSVSSPILPRDYWAKELGEPRNGFWATPNGVTMLLLRTL